MGRRVHALLLAAALLLCLTAPANADGWRDGNLHGGGYVTVTRSHPTDSRHVLLGTDVGGVHVSDDGGLTWHLRGTSHLAGKGKRIADVAWHPTLPNVAYALVGDGPASSGGVLVSTDFGWTWSQGATGVAGAGNHVVAGDGLSDAHPRSIGRLLVVDPTRNLLYVGTYDGGIARVPLAADGTTTGLSTWTTIAMANAGPNDRSFVRGIAMDDTDPTVLYVATAQGVSVRPGGVWRISSANGASPTVAQLTGAPVGPEELDVLDGNLYAVANPVTLAQRGLYRLGAAKSAAVGAAWRQVQAVTSSDTGTYWYGIEAERRGMQTRIWITAENAWRVGGNPEGYHVVGRGESLDGFETDGTWKALPELRTDAPNDVGGPGHVGVPNAFWKFGVPANGVYCWLGYDPQFTASAIAIDPNDGDTVTMAGQCTAWRSTDAGETWYPVPEGIQLLVNSRIAADPDTAGRAFIASADMRGFSTTDAFVNPKLLGIKEDLPGVDSAANNAHALWIDSAATPNATYLSFGDSDANTRGYLVRNTDPFGAGDGTWEYLLTPSDTALGTDQGKRVDGVGVVRDPAAPGTEIVLASVQDSGIWRKVGTGAWTKATGFTTSGYDLYPATVQFAWRPGMTKVYMYDRETGLYRSNDYGATWTRVLVTPNGSNNRQGSLAVHPTNQDVVYLATYSWVRVVANAGTAAADAGTATNLGLEFSSGTIGRPGAIAMSPNGRVYVTTAVRTSPPEPSRIYRATTSATGITGGWTDVSDNNWRAMADSVAELSVGPDETVYAGQGNATLVLDGGTTSTDTTPPTLTRTAPASSPHAWTAPVTASYTATDPSGIELVTFRLDGTAIDAMHAGPYSVVLNPAGRSVGSHTLQVSARDDQGNVATATLTLDIAAPPPPDTTGPTLTRTAPASSPHTWAGITTATWTASDASGVADVTFRLDGAVVGTDSTPPYSVVLDPTGQSVGPHQLQATARDTLSNATVDTLDLDIVAPPPPDTTPPTLTRTAPASSPHSWIAPTTATWTASDVSGVVDVAFRLDGTLIATDSTPPYSVVVDPAGRSAGAHVLVATARDTPGNTITSTLDLDVPAPPPADTTAPTITRLVPSGSPHTWSASFTATWLASDSGGIADVTYQLDGSVLAIDAVAPYSVTLDPTGRSAGAHTLVAIARDTSGNTATSTLQLTVPQPQVPADPAPLRPVTTQPVAVSPTATAPTLSWPVGANASSWRVSRTLLGVVSGEHVLGTVTQPSITDALLAEPGLWRYTVIALGDSLAGDAMTVDVLFDPDVPSVEHRAWPRASTTTSRLLEWTVIGGPSGVGAQELVMWTRPSARPDAPLRITTTPLAAGARTATVPLASGTTTCVAVRATSGTGIASIPAATCTATATAAARLAHGRSLRTSRGDLVLARRGDALPVARRGAKTIVVFVRPCRACGRLDVVTNGRVRTIDTSRGRGVVAVTLSAGTRPSVLLRAHARGRALPVRVVGVALLRG